MTLENPLKDDKCHSLLAFNKLFRINYLFQLSGFMQYKKNNNWDR